MRRLLLLLLLLAIPAFAGDIYITQNASGSDTGANCANAHSAAWFNSNAVGGNTYHLCGTFTGAANASPILTVPADGTAGNPLIVLAESGALFTAPYWSGNYIDSGELHGAIVNGHNYVILDGGTNGTIQNTASGTALTYQLSTWGMASTGNNVIIRNWTIQNIYVATNAAIVSQADRTVDLELGGTNVTVCNNLLTYAYAGIMDLATGSSSTQVNDCQANTFGTGVNIFLNTFQNQPWNLNISPGVAASHNVYANSFQLAGPWGIRVSGCAGTDAHTDGIIVYNTNAAMVSPFIYNNEFNGSLGNGCPTAHIFCSYGTATAGSSCTVFNNVFIETGSYSQNAAAILTNGNASQSTGPTKVYNNTFTGSQIAYAPQNAYVRIPNETFWNNVTTSTSSFQGALWEDYYTKETFSMLSTDHNAYYAPNNTSSPFHLNGADYANLTAWKNACVAGSGVTCDSNSIYGNPNLDANYKPQAGSNAIGLGANLTSSCTGQMAPLCYDKPPSVGKGGSLGGNVQRPTGSTPWDAGAYQYGSGGSTKTALSPMFAQLWPIPN